MTKHPIRTRLGGAAAAATLAAALVSASLAGASPVAAATASTPLKIGVDAAAPSGHQIEYTDFFPRTGINVHNGDVLDFNLPGVASPDATHIVAILKQGESASQVASDPANALIQADSDEPGSPPIENTTAFFGTNPPPGSGAPGACGDQTTPCTYDGTSELIGAELGSPDQGGVPDFFVKLALPSGFTGTVTAVDIGHPIKEPSATINVVDAGTAASAQSDLDQAAASQYQSDTSAALAAESSANHDTVTTNSNGTHNHTVTVGPATQYTESMAFFPQTVHAAPGDTVTYNYAGISDPHTASFPGDPNLAFPVSPFTGPVQCEGAQGDTPGDENAGPPFGCSSPQAVELSFLPQPMGPSVVRRPAYRMVSADGGIFDFGQAAYHGSAGSLRLRSPIVATTSTGDQRGYYEVAADGGVFTYGNARFHGSLAGKTLKAPIVAIQAAPDNSGYILVGADGQLYGLGDVPPLPGAPPVHSPVVGLGIQGNPNGPPGFWLATANGGVFSLAGAPYFGSMAGRHLAAPIVGIQGTLDGGGYWLVAADGGVFSFGDAVFSGSMGGHRLNAPVVGIDTAFTEASSGVLINIPAGNPNALPSRTSYTYTFPDRGSFGYICEFHEMMTGTVVVS